MADSTYMVLNPIPTGADPCWDDIPEVLTTAEQNLAGTACIVKWQGAKPASLPAGTEYTVSEIKQYMLDNIADWSLQLDD